MKAVILAAGEGTRLKPLTLETPKCLIEISNKPIIERIFESLPDEIDEVIIVVDYLKDKIISYLGENFFNKKIIYVNQNKDKKGTYGALLSTKNIFKTGERFLILNGDDLHTKDELEKFLENNGRSFGIQRMVMPNYYSIVVNENYVEKFRPQTEDEKINGTMVATGVYVLDTNIFEHPGVQVYGGEYGLPQTILVQRDRYPIKAIATNNWVPINSFADIEKVTKLPYSE